MTIIKENSNGRGLAQEVGRCVQCGRFTRHVDLEDNCYVCHNCNDQSIDGYMHDFMEGLDECQTIDEILDY